MRNLARVALAAAATTVLLGCASARTGPGITATERQELQAACTARGGILVPSGAATGRPALDDFCEIRGGGSSIQR